MGWHHKPHQDARPARLSDLNQVSVLRHIKPPSAAGLRLAHVVTIKLSPSSRTHMKHRTYSQKPSSDLFFLSLLVQEGKVPRTQVKLSGGDVLTVDSLGGVVQLNALRAFLADGFQTHLQVHTLLFSFECHNYFAPVCHQTHAPTHSTMAA